MNKKIIAAIIFIVIIASGIFIWHKKGGREGEKKNRVYKTQIECEKSTGMYCVPGGCDYKCPIFEYSKGWMATSRKLEEIKNDKNDISSWQTYRNEKYGIEFRYPKDWMEDVDNRGVVFNGVKKDDKNTSRPYMQADAYITIFLVDNPKNLSIQDMFNAINKNCLEDIKMNFMGCPGAENVSAWKNIVLDGAQAWRSGMRSIPENVPVDDVYIKLQDKYLVLRAFSITDTKIQKPVNIEYIFNQVISTFKFIDSDNNTADWQTYRNEKYGFEFKYLQDDFINGEPGAESDQDLDLTCPYKNGFCVFNFKLALSREWNKNNLWLQKTYSLPLPELAVEIWKKEKENENPDFSKDRVGELHNITFEGKKAYEFYFGDVRHIIVSNGKYIFEIIYEKNNSIQRQTAQTFKFIDKTDNKELSCTKERRGAEVCAEIYTPVCATVEIQCIKAPCDPIKQTFSNACEACKNSLVKTYANGECTVKN